MRIHVDRAACQNHGQCVIVGPSIFHLDNESEMHYGAVQEESERALVEEAMDACPTQAITIID
jgi:ferredoxin